VLSLPANFNLKGERKGQKKKGLYKSSGAAHAALLSKNLAAAKFEYQKEKIEGVSKFI
jgi:hypothetical protein